MTSSTLTNDLYKIQITIGNIQQKSLFYCFFDTLKLQGIVETEDFNLDLIPVSQGKEHLSTGTDPTAPPSSCP